MDTCERCGAEFLETDTPPVCMSCEIAQDGEDLGYDTQPEHIYYPNEGQRGWPVEDY